MRYMAYGLSLLAPVSMALELNKPVEELSCAEVVEIAKASGCAEPVQGFLDGAHIDISLAIKGTNINVHDKSSGDLEAHMTSTGVPSPGISLSLAPSFFGQSRFGWSLGFTYDDSYALEQRIRRSGKNKDVDLGSYITTTMIAAEPSLFYQWGESKRYFRAGFGLALGYAAVRGNVYITEDKSNNACYQAGSDLFDNGSTQAIKQNCEQVRFDERRFATGAALFFRGKINRWQLGVAATTLSFHKKEHKLSPSIISVELSYSIPI